MHLVPNIVFAACFIFTLAISQPAPAQDTSGHAGPHPEGSYLRPEKSALPDSLSARQHYVCRRWGHDVLKRKRQHSIGYNAGECLLVPGVIVGYALQGYNGGYTTPLANEIIGGALGLLGLGVGIMYLGSRHEARHPKKFLSAVTVKTGKTNRG